MPTSTELAASPPVDQLWPGQLQSGHLEDGRPLNGPLPDGPLPDDPLLDSQPGISRVGRTRIRVAPGRNGARCTVRTSVTGSDPSAPSIRPMITRHDPAGVTLCLVPEGALLLSGDAIGLDLEVEAGVTVEVIEPGGTVAFDMRGGSASWDVRIRVAAGGALTWAGEPFVVSQGARVTRRMQVTYAEGARLGLRETLVLGRTGEPPGVLWQRCDVRRFARPVLIEALDLDRDTSPELLGRSRVVSTVLALGLEPGPEHVLKSTMAAQADLSQHRFDLAEPGATLWRRLAVAAHEATLEAAWHQVRTAVLGRRA